MIAARCSCGFTELADEEITDHLEWVFEPDDLRGNDGLVHEERGRLACACGLSAVTPGEMDAHFVALFTPDDAIGRDGRKHELAEAHDGAWPSGAATGRERAGCGPGCCRQGKAQAQGT